MLELQRSIGNRRTAALLTRRPRALARQGAVMNAPSDSPGFALQSGVSGAAGDRGQSGVRARVCVVRTWQAVSRIPGLAVSRYVIENGETQPVSRLW